MGKLFIAAVVALLLPAQAAAALIALSITSAYAENVLGGGSEALASCKVADPTGTPLNVRTKPNANSVIVEVANNGDEADVIDRDGNWVFVRVYDTHKDAAPIMLKVGFGCLI
jgi:uncharacterized protein YgiM (DUF1202 family)